MTPNIQAGVRGTGERRRGGIILASVILVVVLASAGTWPKPVLPPAKPSQVDVAPRSVAAIPPKTVIGDRAPPGWTHLIFRSHPRVEAESIPKIAPLLAHMASLLFTVMVAKVEPDSADGGERRFHLTEVAVGVGTKVNGQYMVLSPSTQKDLGANLGLVDRQVLAGGQEEMDLMRCVARSPSMAILDAPSYMLYGQKHHTVVIRHAILVDATTGQLETLMWPLERDRESDAEPLGPIAWLEPNKIVDCVLHVDSNKINILGLTMVKDAFAMAVPPKGRKSIDVPEELKKLVAAKRFTPDSARALEKQLRDLLWRTGGR
jgi:hypothetical protein